MAEALKQYGKEVNVMFAGTAEECFCELPKKKYDVIVIDFSLSDMDGLHVLGNMNNKGYYRKKRI
jgi:CheY-like chemotaxis protein